MVTFNYLGESVPSAIDRLRAVRVAEYLRSPLLGLAAVACIVVAWWGIERHSLGRALAEERLAQTRLEASQLALRAANVERSGVERMIALDRRLRAIRLTGALLGTRLADIANRVSDHAWLTSLVETQGTIDLSGRVEGIAPLAETISALESSRRVANPTLLRAAKEDRSGGPLVTFEVRVDE